MPAVAMVVAAAVVVVVVLCATGFNSPSVSTFVL